MSDASSVLVSASILNADFSRLDRVVHKMERAGADRLHLDVMDGHFVDNITFGPDLVAAFRRLTDMPLDVHLIDLGAGALHGPLHRGWPPDHHLPRRDRGERRAQERRHRGHPRGRPGSRPGGQSRHAWSRP